MNEEVSGSVTCAEPPRNCMGVSRDGPGPDLTYTRNDLLQPTRVLCGATVTRWPAVTAAPPPRTCSSRARRPTRPAPRRASAAVVHRRDDAMPGFESQTSRGTPQVGQSAVTKVSLPSDHPAGRAGSRWFPVFNESTAFDIRSRTLSRFSRRPGLSVVADCMPPREWRLAAAGSNSGLDQRRRHHGAPSAMSGGP